MHLSEIIVILVLAGLNIWQHWFWTRNCGQLIDKLMSRNYAEYKSVEQSVSSPNVPNSHQDHDPTNDQILNELNGILGGPG